MSGLYRPKRKAVPQYVRLIVAERQGGVCKCGCGTPIWTGKKCNVQWDHEPALRLRDIDVVAGDYIPPQHDPRYLDGLCRDAHQAKTNGTGASTAGTDTGKIKKERKRMKGPKKFKKRIQSRGFEKSKPMRRDYKPRVKILNEDLN